MLKLVLTNHKNVRVECSLSSESEFFQFVNQAHHKIEGIFQARLYIADRCMAVRDINKKPRQVYNHHTKQFYPFTYFLNHYADFPYQTQLLYAQYIHLPEVFYSATYL